MNKKLLLLVFVILVSLTVFSSHVSAEESLLSFSLLNQDPDPALAGDVIELRIGIENEGGGSAENVFLEFLPYYPFELVDGQNAIQDLGTIGSYQSGSNIKVIKYNLKINKDVIAGSYDVKFKEIHSGSDNSVQRTVSVDVVSSTGAEIIYIDQVSLEPGKQEIVKFTINNVGNSPLRDLTFYWQNEDEVILPVGSDNTKYIQYIDVGESEVLTYNVIADSNADPGLYKLDLFLSYDDLLTYEEKEINTIAGMYVGGGTNFDVALSETSGSEMSFSIANIGSNEASSVSVVVPSQSSWKAIDASTVMIGNLDKGDYTVASFTIQQIMRMPSIKIDDDSQTNLHQIISDDLLLEIVYTDTMGQRLIVEKYISMGDSSNSMNMSSEDMPFGNKMRGRPGEMNSVSSFSKYVWYFVGLAIFSGIIIILRKYKIEKRMDEHYRLVDMFKKKTVQKNKTTSSKKN